MDRPRIWKLILLIGLLSFSGFIAAVRWVPISGYELSLYQIVPLSGWVLLAIVVISGVFLIVGSNTQLAQLAGSSLVILFAIGIAGLPLFRGYTAFGGLDTFVHIGFITDLLNGIDITNRLLYPGMHYLAYQLVLVLEVPIGRVLLICVVAYALIFVVFIGLSTRRAFPSRRAVGYGVMVGALFAPIMTVQLAVMNPVPATMAIFFLAICIYAFIGYLLNSYREEWRFLFFFLPIVLAILHPQHALAFIFSLTAISVALFHVKPPEGTNIYPGTPLLVAIVVSMTVYLLVGTHPVFGAFTVSILTGIGSGGTSAGAISGTATGLSNVGGSLVEVALKILLPKIAISAIATGVVLFSLRAVLEDRGNRRLNASILCLAAGTVPVTGLVLVTFAAGALNQATRYAGYILVFGSVIASIGFVSTNLFAEDHAKMKATISILAVIFILITVPALYSSPYVYQGSNHIPESERTGYSFAFSHQEQDIGIASTRSRVDRHQMMDEGRTASLENPRHARTGSQRQEEYYLPYHFQGKYPSQVVNQSTYLALPESDTTVDLQLYDGYRYSENDYERLGNDRGAMKLYSNGHFDYFLLIE